jgi:hypothetical protein
MIRSFLIIIFLTLLSAKVSFAQNTAVKSVSSAGTIAASVLESAGYLAQHKVMTQLGDLIQAFAIFIFVFGCGAALVTFVIFGEFERALPILIIPSIFYFAINTTNVGNAVEWRLGNFSGDQRQVSTTLDTAVGKDRPKEYVVSWAFDYFNRFISSVYQGMIAVITSERSEKVARDFMTKETIMKNLLDTKIETGGLAGLSAETLFVCSKEMEDQRTVALGNRDPEFKRSAEWLAANNKSGSWSLKTKSVNQSNFNYLKGILPHYAVFFGNPASTPFTVKGRNQEQNGKPAETYDLPSNKIFDTCKKSLDPLFPSGNPKSQIESLPNTFSCEQLWCGMLLGVRFEVKAKSDNLQQSFGLTNEQYDEMLRAIAHKLADPKEFKDEKGQAIDGEKVLNPDPSIIPLIVGGFMIKDIMVKQSASLSGVVRDAGLQAPIYSFTDITNSQGREELAQRQIGYYISEEKKFELFTFLQGAPYLQGIFLYLLALFFPFFALMLLVPGKSHGFILFFSLWAWVKSWDVGWAAVMTLEPFLWNMVPHSASANIIRDPNFSPISILDIAFHSDPAYGLQFYYMVITTLITSVPIFTAQIMLGAHARLVTPILQGFQGYAQSVVRLGVKPYLQADESGRADRLRELEVKDGLFKEGKTFQGSLQQASLGKPVTIKPRKLNSIQNQPFETGLKGANMVYQANQLQGIFYQPKYAQQLENNGEFDVSKLDTEDRRRASTILNTFGLNAAASNNKINVQQAIISLKTEGNRAMGESMRTHLQITAYELSSQSVGYQAWDGLRAANNARYEPHTHYATPENAIVNFTSYVQQFNQRQDRLLSYLDPNAQQAVYQNSSGQKNQ